MCCLFFECVRSVKPPNPYSSLFCLVFWVGETPKPLQFLVFFVFLVGETPKPLQFLGLFVLVSGELLGGGRRRRPPKSPPETITLYKIKVFSFPPIVNDGF